MSGAGVRSQRSRDLPGFAYHAADRELSSHISLATASSSKAEGQILNPSRRSLKRLKAAISLNPHLGSSLGSPEPTSVSYSA